MTIVEQRIALDPPPSIFVGRDVLLESLRVALQSERLAVLTGSSGSGKTALAYEYVHRFAHEYAHVLWLDATTPEALIAGVLNQEQHLPQPLRQKAQKGFAGISELIEQWASTQQDALLVLDNVIFPEGVPQEQEPRLICGHVLLIGRDTESRPTGACLAVKTLDAREGALLVLRQAGFLAADASLEQTSDAQYRQSLELARELAGSPLALRLAGSYLGVTGCSLQDYLFAYRDCPERPDSSSDRITQILEVVCDLTLANLEQSQPVALRILQLCALLSPDVIPPILFLQESLQKIVLPEGSKPDDEQLLKAMRTLLTYTVLNEHNETHTLNMHPVLQAVVRRTLSQQQQHELREHLLAACLQLALAYEKESMSEIATSCITLAGHIRFLVMGSEGNAFSYSEAAKACVWAASLLSEQGLIREAEALFRKALDVWERTRSSTHLEVAGVLLHLAICNARLQQYTEAEAYAHRAIVLTAQVLGGNHLRVLYCLNTLADIYRQQGKLNDASYCYRKVLSIGERFGFQQHPLYLAAQNELLK